MESRSGDTNVCALWRAWRRRRGTICAPEVRRMKLSESEVRVVMRMRERGGGPVDNASRRQRVRSITLAGGGGPVDIAGRRRRVRSISPVGGAGPVDSASQREEGPVDSASLRKEVRSIAPVGDGGSGRYRRPARGGPVDSARRRRRVWRAAPPRYSQTAVSRRQPVSYWVVSNQNGTHQGSKAAVRPPLRVTS